MQHCNHAKDYMNVTETSNEALKKEFKVVVPAKVISARCESKLAELSKTTEVKGFRKGKVPLDVIKKKYNDAVIAEVVDHEINHSADHVVSDRKLKVAAQPKVDVTSFSEGSDLEYSLSVEVFPDFDIPDFAKIKLKKTVAEIGEAELSEALERLAKGNAKFEVVEDAKYKAKTGDVVVIDFLGKLDGTPFEGGKGEGFSLELGSNQFIPGFEDQLVGTKAGAEVTVNVTFPTEYHAANLAGKEAVFEVKVHEIKKANVPEITDEFAKQFGLEGADALKDKVKEQISKQYEEVSYNMLKKDLFDALEKLVDFPIPAGIFEEEITALVGEAKKEGGKETEEELRKKFTPVTERRVRLGILLKDVGAENKIQIDQAELRESLYAKARAYPGYEHQIVEMYKKNPRMMESLKGPILEDKVVKLILEKVNVTEKAVPAKKMLDIYKENDSI